MENNKSNSGENHNKPSKFILVILFSQLFAVCFCAAAQVYFIVEKIYGRESFEQQQLQTSFFNDKFKGCVQTSTRQYDSINRRLNSTEVLMQQVLQILQKTNCSKYNANSVENKLHFSQQEIQNFEPLLDKSKYTIQSNVPISTSGMFRYKHIIRLPFNFQLIIFMTKYDNQYNLYLQHIAGSFQAFFMIHSSTYTLEYLKSVLTGAVKYGFRYPDAVYPGSKSSSGYYQPNGNNFFVREQFGYQVDAHEFVHMLDFHMSPQKYSREGEQYVDGLANLLSGVCNRRLDAYRTISDLIRNVGEDKRYDYGPPLVAFFLSNQQLRIFHTKFTRERSKDNADYAGLEKTLIRDFSFSYNPQIDYCRVFYDTLSYFSDFWSKDFQNHINANFEVISDYIA